MPFPRLVPFAVRPAFFFLQSSHITIEQKRTILSLRSSSSYQRRVYAFSLNNNILYDTPRGDFFHAAPFLSRRRSFTEEAIGRFTSRATPRKLHLLLFLLSPQISSPLPATPPFSWPSCATRSKPFDTLCSRFRSSTYRFGANPRGLQVREASPVSLGRDNQYFFIQPLFHSSSNPRGQHMAMGHFAV